MNPSIQQFDSREAWLLARQNSIGASEAAALVGLSTYQSAYSIWYRKTEPIQPDEPDELAYWGTRLEPVIADEFWRQAKDAIRNAMQLIDPGDFTIYRDKSRPYLTCTPDRLLVDGDKFVAPVELKTAHFKAADVWKKEVPEAYLVQIQVQIHILECSHAYVAVLIEGREFRWHRVSRHQRFIDLILRRVDHFWHEHVIKRVPPPTDYHEATTKALLRKYPTANGSVIELLDECESLYDEMKQLTAAESAAGKRKEEIKNAIRERMGAARYGYLASGKGFQWSGENGSRRFSLTERCPEPNNGHAA